MKLLEKTISALVHTIAADHDLHPSLRRSEPYLDVTAFVFGQVAHMTAPLRLPMRIVTCGLSVLSLLTTGRLFHRLPLEKRRLLVDRWRTSALSPVRDVIRFYESLTVLSLYSLDAA
jgi:hypothetical protein